MVIICPTTQRQAISANEHLREATMLVDDGWHVIEPHPVQVFNRIGGSDGFTGGLLHTVVQGL